MILIRKVSEPYGWMGNMSPYVITHENKHYRTSEALFQSLRFKDNDVIEEIRSSKSPMSAKMIAKKHKSKMFLKPLSNEDLENMRLVIRLKLEQHPDLLDQLLKTKDDLIVEDCTKRPRGSGLFWGAAFQNDCWKGENWLGKIWMSFRENYEKLANNGT
jgi:ribA/ribD-fused uncharacterized protein